MATELYFGMAALWALVAFVTAEERGIEAFGASVLFGALWPLLMGLTLCAYLLGTLARIVGGGAE